MPRYTLCPYYVDENKKTISCEDVIRRFATYRSKNRHMDKFCDKDWQSCPHAVALTQMYEDCDTGSDPDRIKLEHKSKALEKENKKMLSLLGRYDIRILSKDKEISQIRKKNRELEDALHKEHRKRKEAERRTEQPEIVRCKDCKNSEHWYRDRRRCFLWSEDGVSVFDDGFCSYAERRTDG